MLRTSADRLSAIQDLERLAVVASAVADVAVHVDVGQEVHLDLDRAVSGARLAAPAFHVEGEPSLLVAAHLRLLGLGEEFANLVEDPRIRRGVRARGATNGLLVNGHHLVDVLHPEDGVVLGDLRLRAIDLTLQDASKMALISDDLPEPETPVTATKSPRGMSTVMFCRLLARRP
jgi:hypothetical protein